MLEEFSILDGLSQNQIQNIEKICDRRYYQNGQYIFRENSESLDSFEVAESTSICFLISGTVGLYKASPETQDNLKFKEMGAGESLGEMSFIDDLPRSCSVCAETEVEVWILYKQALIESIPDHLEIFNLLNKTVNRQVNEHLRNLSNQHVITLQKQIEDLKERNQFGYFLFFLVLGFFLAISIEEFADIFPERGIASTTLFNWIYLVFVGIVPFILVLTKIKLSFKSLINPKREIKKALLEGVVVSGVGILAIFGVCAIIQAISPEQLLVQKFLGMAIPASSIFYLFHSYVQEFVRAIVQTLVQRFMLDRSGYRSVLVTALAFSIVHANYGFESMMVTLVGSTFFGLVYRRTYNLVGPTIVHFFLGLIYLNLSSG